MSWTRTGEPVRRGYRWYAECRCGCGRTKLTRVNRDGTPLTPRCHPCSLALLAASRTATRVERFWSKVDKNGPTPSHYPHLGPCWVWTGAVDKDGYGKFEVGVRNQSRAHRFSWSLAHGDPGNRQVLHHCDNPPCVNPDHLFDGTAADNVRDRDAKGRQAKGDRAGLRVHPERAARGDRNGSRLYPERLPHGEEHWRRRHPERVPRGPTHSATMKRVAARGESCHSHKLVAAQVTELRSLYASGHVTHAALAKRFGVSQKTIGLILRRKSWTHAP